MLRKRPDGEPLGCAAIVVGRGSPAERELAYELLPRAHGRGYATEAGAALLDAAFETGRRRIWATIGFRNTGSLRVAGKPGFRRPLHNRSRWRGGVDGVRPMTGDTPPRSPATALTDGGGPPRTSAAGAWRSALFAIGYRGNPADAHVGRGGEGNRTPVQGFAGSVFGVRNGPTSSENVAVAGFSTNRGERGQVRMRGWRGV